jgi:hypothetical protein
MTFAEKVLYHQIHPLKLTTDIGAELVSLPLFWLHWLWLGLVAHFAPPVIVSALLLRFADLAPQKNSLFGRYVRRMMTRPVEAARFLGDLVMVIGAWYHSPFTIAAGAGIVLLAWLKGIRLFKAT